MPAVGRSSRATARVNDAMEGLPHTKNLKSERVVILFTPIFNRVCDCTITRACVPATTQSTRPLCMPSLSRQSNTILRHVYTEVSLRFLWKYLAFENHCHSFVPRYDTGIPTHCGQSRKFRLNLNAWTWTRRIILNVIWWNHTEFHRTKQHFWSFMNFIRRMHTH